MYSAALLRFPEKKCPGLCSVLIPGKISFTVVYSTVHCFLSPLPLNSTLTIANQARRKVWTQNRYCVSCVSRTQSHSIRAMIKATQLVKGLNACQGINSCFNYIRKDVPMCIQGKCPGHQRLAAT